MNRSVPSIDTTKSKQQQNVQVKCHLTRQKIHVYGVNCDRFLAIRHCIIRAQIELRFQSVALNSQELRKSSLYGGVGWVQLVQWTMALLVRENK